MTTDGRTFVTVYLLLMIPTYLLPWAGSNSTFVFLATLGTNPFFWLHLLALGLLCALASSRGQRIGKGWLVSLPLLALVFDLAPGLNLIPFVPTVLHVFAMLLGYSPAPRSA